MNDKLTKNEMAERQQNALIASGLSNVPKPPVGIGSAECIECGEPIPMARRKACGNGICVYCADILTDPKNIHIKDKS